MNNSVAPSTTSWSPSPASQGRIRVAAEDWLDSPLFTVEGDHAKRGGGGIRPATQ